MLRHLALLGLALAPAGLLHCSGDTTATPPRDPTRDAATTTPDGSTAQQPGPAAPVPGECGVDKMCLDVVLEPAPAADFFVNVYWIQLDDDGPDPVPEVAYRVGVKAGTTRIEIPLSSVGEPVDQGNLYCERATEDEATSPCLSEPQVSYGYVTMSTGADPAFSKETTLASANAIFGFSTKAFAPGTAPARPADWDRLWPEGIQEGVRIYQVARPEGGAFDRPVPSPAGAVNKLAEKGVNLT